MEFVIGLGIVVFVHELGHFLVAKAVDIRVKQFALGFGTRLFGIQKGETEYRVNLIPLGGYVKLEGQEDFGPVRDTDQRDPRSFSNKTVASRFAVISAGVIMNVLLACVLFIIVGLVGIRFPAPIVGGTIPGSPAETAKIQWQNSNAPVSTGFQPGDRILDVDGRSITRFNQLIAMAALADADHEFTMHIQRRQDGRTMEGVTKISVKEMEGTLHFGVVPASSTTLAPLGNIIADDPFRQGDRVMAINGQPIRYNWQVPGVEARLDGKPVMVTVLRDHKKTDIEVQPTLQMDTGVFFLKDGTRITGTLVQEKENDRSVVIRLPDGTHKILLLSQVVWPARNEILDILGLIPRTKILSVMEGSPAFKAGLKPGDIILEYNKKPSPTLQMLRHTNERVAKTGAAIVVLRGGNVLSAEVHPETDHGRKILGITSGLDLSHPVIAHIREGSPAASAGMTLGGTFTGVTGKAAENWIELFEDLKALQNREIVISLKQSDPDERRYHLGVLTTAEFNPRDYHYVLFPGPRGFTILMGQEIKKNPAAAMIWGFHEAGDFILMTYAGIVSYFRGTVSSKEFRGPVGIGSIAIQVGREGIIPFIYFMAVISISLAVVNFLPIPVVDGGYAVFLIIEKIIGRPVPEKIQNNVMMLGWVFLILLFLILTWNDIGRILGNR